MRQKYCTTREKRKRTLSIIRRLLHIRTEFVAFYKVLSLSVIRFCLHLEDLILGELTVYRQECAVVIQKWIQRRSSSKSCSRENARQNTDEEEEEEEEEGFFLDANNKGALIKQQLFCRRFRTTTTTPMRRPLPVPGRRTRRMR